MNNPILRKVMIAIFIFIFVNMPIGYILEKLLSNPLVHEKISIALSMLVAMLGLVFG